MNTALYGLLGSYPPKWVLHRGQVATVHENPGNQEKCLSAGQCWVTSAFLNVITSNWCPWGFSKSWMLTLRPPISVSFRLESASRLWTWLMSVPNASSCPHALHSIRVAGLVSPSSATAAHASPGWYAAGQNRRTKEIYCIMNLSSCFTSSRRLRLHVIAASHAHGRLLLMQTSLTS